MQIVNTLFNTKLLSLQPRPVAVPRDWIVLHSAVQCWKAPNQFLDTAVAQETLYIVMVPSVPTLNNSSYTKVAVVGLKLKLKLKLKFKLI